MGKSRTQSKPLQVEEPSAATVTVEIPRPVLSTLQEIQEGFFELCVRVGRQVLTAMMEEDRIEVCGPKNVPNPERTAQRGGTVGSEITLGGRRIEIRRLRAQTVSGTELQLPSYAFAASRDPLDAHTMAQVAAGVSTRKYAKCLDRLPKEEVEHAISKSSVSRRFVAKSARLIESWLKRPIDQLDLWIVMIDGIVFGDHTIVIALGISASGYKHVLGMHEGSTENATIVQELIDDLIERGLPTDRRMLFVVDGSKALHKSIRNTFGERALVQRCQVHKVRNVLDHLPDHMRASVKIAMGNAYRTGNYAAAKTALEQLAQRLERDHPGAARSLREGMEETLTLLQLGIAGRVYEGLRSTNCIENLNGSIVHFTRNVRRWKDGAMLNRWVGTALLYAQEHFNRLKGHRQLGALVTALGSHSTVDAKRKAA